MASSTGWPSCQTCTARPAGARGIEAQRDLLPDQRRLDLVDDTLEADRAVLMHLAFGLEQEQIVQVQGGLGEAHLLGALRPALQGRFPVEPVMRRLVVLAFDPAPEAAIEGFQALGVGRAEAAQQLRPHGLEEPLDFPLGNHHQLRSHRTVHNLDLR